MKNNSQNILITGATGYIGYNFSKYLVNKGFNVHLLVRSSSNLRDLGESQLTYIHYYNGRSDSIEYVFNNHNINFVFHLATFYDKADDLITLDILNEVCLKLTSFLFEAVKKQKTKIGFINVGTIWQTHENFDNAYTLYKFFQQELSKYYSNKYNVKVLSLLLTDTYGPNDWRPKLLNQLKVAVINGSEFQVINPNTKIDLVFIDDVCDALYQSMDLVMNQKSNFSNYKIQAHQTIGLRAMIISLEMILNHSINVKFGEAQSISEHNISVSIQSLPGWTPRMDLITGLLCFLDDKELFK